MSKPPPDPLFVIRGNLSVIHCALFHVTVNGEYLLVGTEEGTVQAWDLKSCKRIKVIDIGSKACLSLHLTDKYLITQDKTCTLSVWNLSDNLNLVLSKELNNISFCKICLLEYDTTYIAVPQPESLVEIYTFSAEKMQVLCHCRYPDKGTKLGEVLHLKMFRVKLQPYLAAVYENGMLIVWDFHATVIMSEKITNDTPMAFDFDAESLQGICGTAEKNLYIFKLNETWNVFKRKVLEIKNPGTGCLRIRPDRKIVAAGCWDGKIRIFSWKTCSLLAVLDYHTDSVLDVCFSDSTINTLHSKHLLAATASDKRISLWSIYG